jgi:hypothetical protein
MITYREKPVREQYEKFWTGSLNYIGINSIMDTEQSS